MQQEITQIEISFKKHHLVYFIRVLNVVFTILLLVFGLTTPLFLCLLISIILFIADFTSLSKELEKYALFLYTFNGRAFVQLIVALIGFSINAAFFPILFLLMAIIFGLFGHYHIIEFPRYKCIAIKAEVEPLNSVVVERENDLPNYEVVGSVPDEKEGPSK